MQDAGCLTQKCSKILIKNVFCFAKWIGKCSCIRQEEDLVNDEKIRAYLKVPLPTNCGERICEYLLKIVTISQVSQYNLYPCNNVILYLNKLLFRKFLIGGDLKFDTFYRNSLSALYKS